MLAGRRRLPALEFLQKSLTNLIGVLNEKMLPQILQTRRKRKSAVMDDEVEVWCKRKKAGKRKYADPIVAKKLFGKVAVRSGTNKSRTEKDGISQCIPIEQALFYWCSRLSWKCFISCRL